MANCSWSQASMEMLRTNETCAPRLLCSPEQSMHRNTPLLALAHLGFALLRTQDPRQTDLWLSRGSGRSERLLPAIETLPIFLFRQKLRKQSVPSRVVTPFSAPHGNTKAHVYYPHAMLILNKHTGEYGRTNVRGQLKCSCGQNGKNVKVGASKSTEYFQRSARIPREPL